MCVCAGNGSSSPACTGHFAHSGLHHACVLLGGVRGSLEGHGSRRISPSSKRPSGTFLLLGKPFSSIYAYTLEETIKDRWVIDINNSTVFTFPSSERYM